MISALKYGLLAIIVFTLFISFVAIFCSLHCVGIISPELASACCGDGETTPFSHSNVLLYGFLRGHKSSVWKCV